jgi:hypothetical protein
MTKSLKNRAFQGVGRTARLAVLLLACAAASGAPSVPWDDAQVLERLPAGTTGPAAAELRRLRAEVAARPGDPARAALLARRLFELAMAEGDPRFLGYAEAALRPWNQRLEVPADLLVVRGLLRQARHDFDAGLALLGRALEREPSNIEARSWRSAIFLVQADYAAARRECEAMTPYASALFATACVAQVDAAQGRTRSAYERVSAALAARSDVDAELQLWLLTRLASWAARLDQPLRADAHYRAALALGITDNFLLAEYADFLLEARRPGEVLELLRGRERSDTLLLRLALAQHALQRPGAARLVAALGERYAAAALRGERLHLQDEARYQLDLRGDARAALAVALENWKTQREPGDALVLLRAALAARDLAAAAPVLAWLEASEFEHRGMQALARELKALPR